MATPRVWSSRIVPETSQYCPILSPIRREVGATRRAAIDLPVFGWPDPDDRLLRISARQYNTISDYERLAEGFGPSSLEGV